MPQTPKDTISFVCLGVPSADGKSVNIWSCKPVQAAPQAKPKTKKQILTKIETKTEDCGCAAAADAGVCTGAVEDCLGPVVQPTVIPFNNGAATCGGTAGCFSPGRIESSALSNGTGGYQDVIISLGGIDITVHTEDGIHFAWSASGEGVVAVYAKGGQNGQNLYEYDGTVLTDCNLSPPDNDNGIPAEISHIDFCVNPLFKELENVTVYLDTLVTADRDCQWQLSVDADKQDFELACGATASICYTIKARASAELKNYKLSASLTVNNDSAYPLDGLLTWSLGTGTSQYPISVASSSSSIFNFEHSFDSPPSGPLELSYSLAASLVNGACSASKVIAGKKEVDFSEPDITDICGTADLSYTLPGPDVRGLRLSNCQGVELTECVQVGPYTAAGVHEFAVSAVLEADCGVQTASAIVRVTAGDCVVYCIRSSGYWSTHASGDKYNAIWAQIGASGPAEIFYLSGKTYLGVMIEPSSSGTYYIAAQQFVATLLNSYMVAPQSLPASVQTAFDALKAVFETKTPAQVAALTQAQQGVIKANAKILDGFNTGTLPGYPECT